ncbi:aldose 1-epimerase family protein [Reyranella sp.]|uniref:aldose 1-epimerase family protein n=1 Tax=Reyranella sp. TaxID=1929291 RepID=UPI002724BE06|nr:aldose 1-epimerase family protein [Reyranella sp.]MDO8975179.1 aldose 1-epimerase family protein [Reyranella sp.]
MASTVSHSVVSISTAALSAEISATGAELVRLQDRTGADLLWDGNPAVWNGRSPLLFPIVGEVTGNRLNVAGTAYEIGRHGFARTSTFALVGSDAASCTWRLESSEATRRQYPFEFRLDVTYRIEGATLHMEARVTNTGAAVMPASFGFHPALRWPLPYGTSREAHEIVFERDEPAPIRRPVDGLLSAAQFTTPVRDRHLRLHDDLFEDGALVFDTLASRSVLYGEAIRVDFPQMPHLGIWTKPGAGYVCIEPWQGHASPEGFDGELADKPGVIAIAPGAMQSFGMSISVSPPGS